MSSSSQKAAYALFLDLSYSKAVKLIMKKEYYTLTTINWITSFEVRTSKKEEEGEEEMVSYFATCSSSLKLAKLYDMVMGYSSIKNQVSWQSNIKM